MITMISKDELERQKTLISQLLSLEHGIVLFASIDVQKEIIKDKPMMVNTKEIKKDIRYNLGYIDALKWVLNQPVKAQEFLTSIEGERR